MNFFQENRNGAHTTPVGVFAQVQKERRATPIAYVGGKFQPHVKLPKSCQPNSHCFEPLMHILATTMDLLETLAVLPLQWSRKAAVKIFCQSVASLMLSRARTVLFFQPRRASTTSASPPRCGRRRPPRGRQSPTAATTTSRKEEKTQRPWAQTGSESPTIR